MILDCHTHHPAPYQEGVISISPILFDPVPGQSYSVGFHPWELDLFCGPDMRIKEDCWSELVMAASNPAVVAIGECGIDLAKGPLLAMQMLAFRRQALLAERLERPLMIHAVKSHDIIIGLKRDLKPSQPWIIHGFRGKPSIAKMYLDAGCMLSYGEKFNPESLVMTPDSMILAETDESLLSIDEIIAGLDNARELAGKEDLKAIITENSKIFIR